MAKLAELEKKLLHYTGKAIADFNMIQRGDRVMVCLSGGKDSFTLLRILTLLQQRVKVNLNCFRSRLIKRNQAGTIPR